LELAIKYQFDPAQMDNYLAQLDVIELTSINVKIYGSLGADYFRHRQHIRFVRSLLYKQIEKSSQTSEA
jgi:hypothetical protein